MLKFLLPPDYDLAHLAAWLTCQIEPTAIPVHTNHVILYDTFDWRLFRQSLALIGSDSRYTLYDLAADRAVATAVMPEAPVFVWDLPHGLLRARLDPIIRARALLAQADVLLRTTAYLALSQEGEPQAGLEVEEIRPSARAAFAPVSAVLAIQPLPEQGAAAQAMAERLVLAGVTAVATTYHAALAAAGQTPGSYATRPDIALTPDMRADEATKTILRYLFQVMRANEAYIQQDIDTEFLHDFRVAVRRTRSALGQIKAVFPPESTDRFKEAFKVIGKLSNQLRDLDVYLLAEEEYKVQLAPFLRDQIDPLFVYLRQKRIQALQDVSDGLQSAAYRQVMADWEAFLAEPEADEAETAVSPPGAPKAATPIIKLARRRIYKRYLQVMDAGQIILAQNQHGLMHSLRIECKKLRYLMEFFADLFPPDELGLLIRRLKLLQTHLGDLNDLNVQQAYLLHIADELPLTRKHDRRALVAIGWLVANLEQKKTQAKAESAAAFSQFAAAENAQLFAKLFNPPQNS